MMPRINKGDEEMAVKLNRNCQFCTTPTPAVWDAKHKTGPLAYFCDAHFKLLAHPGFAGAATKLIPDPPTADPTIDIFPPQEGATYGSEKYFELAIAAGYFGCDDDQ